MKTFVTVLIALALIGATALAGVYVHSRRPLSALSGQLVYASPEDGMRDMVTQRYTGLRRMEIVHAGYEPCFLDNLYFVEARVWAAGRTDGKAVGDQGENRGGFFLRCEQGWVWIAEDRLPWFVALGQWLFPGRCSSSPTATTTSPTATASARATRCGGLCPIWLRDAWRSL